VFTYSDKHVQLKETKKTTSFPFRSPSTCKSYSQIYHWKVVNLVQ